MMKSTTRKILIGMLICLLTVTALLSITAYVLHDRVKDIVMTQVNAQLTEPLNINGTIDFSLLQNFPYASVIFNDIDVKNKLNKGPEYLLKVKKFSLLFNMYGLLTDHIDISRVRISDGEFNIFIDAKGNADYEIFKPSADTSKAAKPLNLDIKQAVLKNLKFTYLSEGKEEDVRLLIGQYSFSGDFHADQFDLTTTGDMMIGLIRLNNMEYLAKKSFSAAIVINIDQKQDHFKLSKGNIVIDKNSFDVQGYFIGTKKNTYVDFTAESQGKDISHLIALIPLRYKSKLAGTDGSGGYDVKARIVGNIRAHINPDIKVTAILTNAQIKIPELRLPLVDVNADGYYHMDSTGMDGLVIKKFKSSFDGQPQDFSLKLTDLSEPDFIFDADGVADLRAMRKLFGDSTFSSDGQVIFKKFHIAGSKKDIDNEQYSNIKAFGDFTFKNIQITSGGITYSNINGNLTYNDQDIAMRGLTLTLLKTSILFSGNITNVLGYIISQSKRTNTPDLALGIDGRLTVRDLDLNKIITSFAKTNTAKPATATTSAKAAVDPYDIFNMKGHLVISVDKFLYQKIELDDMQADLGISPDRLDIHSLTTHAMGGTISDTSYIAFRTDRSMVFTLGLTIGQVDLQTLFIECDNFKQTTLTDRNLKGSLSANINLKTIWNNYNTIDLDKLEGTIECSVVRGELNNFEPLRAASKFIKMEDLNHIVFSDLTNQLYIKNKVITIPRMEVQSSALNLMMEGSHTLDNQIDYKLKVNLRKLLAAKFGRKQDSEAYIEEDPYEGVNLYLSLLGDISSPKIKLDRKGVKDKLKTDLAAQKDELKDIFGKGKHKKEKNADEAKREEKYYDTRKKPEFIDFQEDTAK